MPFEEMEISFETPSALFGVPLPKLGWKGKLAPDDSAQRLAWALYVELTTRIAIAGLERDEGSLREALSSYHTLFQFTRDRLHQIGPRIGRPSGSNELPIGAVALWMLNGVVRPLLARWHPLLKRYEEIRPADTGEFAHEAAWSQQDAFRRDLDDARRALHPFAQLFEKVCQISPSLLPV